ncbi:drug/metabolite exporter YedA [Deinococcus roseus]|uniref:Drug/metabolite exporter YedA n=1 Tax=Deinococcus roseus TaxID=392414 RepID=A0ABQ2D9L9_9DEIO|nr:drug/metabolite exporter YedA [Deinococcus roseus]GGJ50456.1 drug/metabolite exporter YedA [Deinococcus roseus]
MILSGKAGHKSRPQNHVSLALVAVYLIWGSTYYAVHLTLQSFPPFLQGGIRFTLAGLLMLAITWIQKKPLPTAKQLFNAFLASIFLVVIGHMLLVYAQQWATSSMTALAAATIPFWSTLWGMRRKQKPTRNDVLGLALGFAGIVLLNLEKPMAATPAGLLCLLIAPVVWAYGSIWLKGKDTPETFTLNSFMMLFAGVQNFAISFLLHEHLLRVPTLQTWGALGFLVVFGSMIAYTASAYLIQNTRPAVATSFAYVNPVIALLLGGLLAGEHLPFKGWLAVAMIIGAVVLVVLKPFKKAP